MNTWDKVFATASWLIVLALVISFVFLWINPPITTGPVAQAIGVFGAQIFYSILYGGEALLLTFAKLTGRMGLRKATLMAIFLTGVFTLTLTISLIGFNLSLLDNLAMFGLSGVCWLYWKFKTEYMSHEEAKEFFKI